MAVTEYQKSRIALHLGFANPSNLSQLDLQVSITTMTANQELSIIGDMTDTDNLLTVNGVILCHNDSILGRVERAYANISPDIIEESLYVSKAGDAVLRGNELSNRQALYDYLREQLAIAMNAVISGNRVGW